MNKLLKSGLLAPFYPPSLSPSAWVVVVACVLLLRPAAVAEPPKPHQVEMPRHERVVEIPKTTPPAAPAKIQPERRTQAVSISKHAPRRISRSR